MNSFFAMALSVFIGSQATGMPPQFSDAQEIACLAQNIYFEARNQEIRGQMAVGHVVMNRVMDDRFPATVCEVVLQGPTRPSWKDKSVHYPIRHRCQFSWYCDGAADKIHPKDENVFEMIHAMAFKIYHRQFKDFTDGATHYHADYVAPEWRHTKTKTTQVGEHIFYRWERN